MGHNMVYIADENYVIPTKASINSAIRNYSGCELNIYVIAVKVSDNSIKQICKLSEQSDSVKITIIKKDDNMSDIGLSHLYVSSAALYKFQLPVIFPELNKILYIDGDTILLPGWESIYDIDIENKYGAATRDINCEKIEKWPEKMNLEYYYNSGVMYLNLEKMREDSCTQKLIDYKKNDIENHFMDQNAINVVLGKKFSQLPIYYNYMLVMEELFPQDELYKFANSIENGYDITKNKIIHLVGEKKAWNSCAEKSFDYWKDYVDSSDILELVKRYILNEKKLQDIRNKELYDSINNEKRRLNDMTIELNNAKIELNNHINYIERHTMWHIIISIYKKIFRH